MTSFRIGIIHVQCANGLDMLLAAGPYEWDTMPTSMEGWFRSFCAFVESIKAQQPDLTAVPDVKIDLVPMPDALEMDFARDLLNACREFARRLTRPAEKPMRRTTGTFSTTWRGKTG